MNKQFRKECADMPVEKLNVTLEELRRDLFKLRLSAATSHVRSFSSEQRRLKRSVACVLTYIHEKSL
jgi:ribosomal protein L29